MEPDVWIVVLPVQAGDTAAASSKFWRFQHCPSSGILKTFRRLDVFPSSREGENLPCNLLFWAPYEQLNQ